MVKSALINVRLESWAGWIAQDANGNWFQYQLRPSPDNAEDMWSLDEKDEYGEVDLVALGIPNPDWKTTLKEVKNA